jgi:hypothetical protein
MTLSRLQNFARSQGSHEKQFTKKKPLENGGTGMKFLKILMVESGYQKKVIKNG